MCTSVTLSSIRWGGSVKMVIDDSVESVHAY